MNVYNQNTWKNLEANVGCREQRGESQGGVLVFWAIIMKFPRLGDLNNRNVLSLDAKNLRSVYKPG